MCGSAEGDLSPNNTQYPKCWKTAKRDIPFSWLFFLHKIDISPTFCLWLFKNQFGSSAFDSLCILNSPVVYSPTSFYIWQRDSTISIFSSSLGLLLLWWAVDMCLFKPETLAHEVWTSFFPLLHDACYSITDWLKKIHWTAKRAEDHRTERPSHLVVEMVKWQVSLLSTPLFSLLWAALNVLSLPHTSPKIACLCVFGHRRWF